MSKTEHRQHTSFPILRNTFGVRRMGDVIFFGEKENILTPFAGGRIAKQDGGYRGTQTMVKVA